MSIHKNQLKRRWFKWYHLYYFLAAFDILTISSTLYLNHIVLGIYSQSVENNAIWSERARQFSRLNELAAAVNAPGNDAFDSGDFVADKRRLGKAYQEFQQATKAARGDLHRNSSQDVSAEPLRILDQIDGQVALIDKEAHAVFAELENNNREAAGSRMAEMDRCFSRSLSLIGRLCEEVRQVQSARFDAETARAHRLGKFEIAIASCVCIILCVVTWYGHKMSKHMRRGEAEVTKAKSAAESANTAKSEFLANMSHEIRTPMTAILGFTDILLGKLSEPEDTDAARTIKDNGEYLLNLINDILDLSKIEAGKVEVEQIDCSPHGIVADVSSLMRVRASAKGLQLEADFDSPFPESIQSDPTRLRQVLINIVGNAIKFTETGSVKIVTRLLNDPGEEPKLRFDVIDTGIGIAEDKIEKLFLAFTQADGSTTRQFGGTGLGLTISKRLAELLGGKISVSSTIGKGSTFSVTVSTGPLGDVRLIDGAVEAAVEAVDVKVANDTKAPLQNRRILLAEDGPDNQRLISFILKKAGAEVTLADNGQIGFDLATVSQTEGCPFDVILMDMQMPVLDGYAATRRLREEGYTRPIVALTAHAMATDRRKCLDAGCDDYTTKPIDRKKLIELVSHYTFRQDLQEAAPTPMA